jgi:hypothetical protein
MQGAEILNSVVGCNAYIEDGVKLEYVMILSNTFYSSESGRAAARAEGKPVVGIGAFFGWIFLASAIVGLT